MAAAPEAKSSSLRDQMLEAAASGDLKTLQELWPPSYTQPESSRTSPEQPKDEEPALHDIASTAVCSDKSNVLQWTFRQGFSPPTSSHNDDFFLNVCCSRSIETLQTLVDHGFDLNAHWNDTVGSLFAAAATDADVNRGRWLLEHGHGPNTHQSAYSLSPACGVVAGKPTSLDFLKLMLEYKATPFTLSGAVTAAAEVGNTEALALLLDYGLDIEEKYHWWQDWDEPSESVGSPLYRACRKGQKGSVEVLLARGADPKAQDAAGVSCYEIAKTRGFADIVEMLEARGAKM